MNTCIYILLFIQIYDIEYLKFIRKLEEHSVDNQYLFSF